MMSAHVVYMDEAGNTGSRLIVLLRQLQWIKFEVFPTPAVLSDGARPVTKASFAPAVFDANALKNEADILA